MKIRKNIQLSKVTNKCCEEKNVDLLLIEEKGKRHYPARTRRCSNVRFWLYFARDVG